MMFNEHALPFTVFVNASFKN